VIRDVLCECRSIDQAGRLHGASSVRDRNWYGSLFRRCLRVLAVQFGFASSTRPPPRLLNGDGMADPAEDPARHAATAELDDPAMRRGRPNGHAR
jgi:hypothetical protein